MVAKTYSLTFGGYWLADAVSSLPPSSGIYGVYACSYNPSLNQVSLRQLLYIGEAANVRDRVSVHERWNDWRNRLTAGERLCFSAADISPQADRERAEAAMIFKHKPPCNVLCKDSFAFDTTTISTSGRNALLHGYFTVQAPAYLGLGASLLSGRTQW